MSTSDTPSTFVDGYRLIDGTELNYKFGNPEWSVETDVAATVGGSVFTSKPITFTITQVNIAAAPNAGVTLPQALPGRVLMIFNTSPNPITVFAAGDSTIDGFPGDIGITQQPNVACYYTATAVQEWFRLDFLPIGFPYQFMQNLTNINALRAWSSLPGSSPAIVALVYNTVPNDGGGLFYLDATDHTSPDNGTTIIVDSVGNRWKRELVSANYIANTPYKFVTATTVQGALNQIIDLQVDNITDLRNFPLVTTTSVFMRGYYAPGDDGAGVFQGVTGASPGTYVDNGGTIIVPASGVGSDGSGAWLRVVTGDLYISAFGGKGDNSSDDTLAVQNAISYANSIAVRPAQTITVSGNGKSYIVDTIELLQSVFLTDITLIPLTSTTDVLYVAPGASFKGTVDTSIYPTYSASGITLDTEYWNANYDNLVGNVVNINACILGTVSPSATGNGILLTTGTTHYIAFVQMNLLIDGFETSMNLYDAGSGASFLNGNTFTGIVRGGRTCIHMHGETVAGNIFFMTVQPVGGVSERGLYFDGPNVGANYFNGFIWDALLFSISSIEWTAGCGNQNRIFTPTRVEVSTIINNSSFFENSYLGQWGALHSLVNVKSFALLDKTINIYNDQFGGGSLRFDVGTANSVANFTPNFMASTKGAAHKVAFPTFQTNVDIDLSLGNFFVIDATTNANFAINTPINTELTLIPNGYFITISIKNTSGGALGSLLWAVDYKLAAFTLPANGFSRSISFYYDGTSWVEYSRTSADVPN